MRVLKDNKIMYKSDDYNYIFNKLNGVFMRWGSSLKDAPIKAPMPEILDFEITEICKGINNVPCPFCYKSNNATSGTYTSLEVAKEVIDKMDFVTQIAFGVDAQCESNPHTFEIMKYAKDKGIVPNVTVADISDEVADKLAELCGAVAVSRYDDKDVCYNSVKKLTDLGMTQVDIHFMLSKETLDNLTETIKDIKNDKRLSKLNAIVLLSLEQKGRGDNYTPVEQNIFNLICHLLKSNNIRYGFDSCSANKYIEFCKTFGYENEITLCEPCESGLFSSYVNVHGDFYPCSFMEGSYGWEEGISVLGKDFINDVWNSKKLDIWREKFIKNNRSCPIYKV